MQTSNAEALTPEERALFDALNRHSVRFMLVGMSAAVLQGADIATQDLDLWFESLTGQGIVEASQEAGGFFAARMRPPMIGGPGLERIDVVTGCDGLDAFMDEYASGKTIVVDGSSLVVLPLERVIASKVVANRAKDRAAIEQLKTALAVVNDRGA